VERGRVLDVTGDLVAGPKLRPAEAVAALIFTPDARYLMQHRDEKPGIFFPGWWGCFGGAVEPGESPADAILRELAEELNFRPEGLAHFATLGLDFSFAGHRILPRHFFTVQIDEAAVEQMRLGEGQALALIPGAELLCMPRVIPYDATVIWQHLSRHRY
jgi:8-oxo-dGTP pyrophosphatase MutT (NUDIX family)